MNNFECKFCNYITKEKSNLNRHLKSKKHLQKVINDTTSKLSKNRCINRKSVTIPKHPIASQSSEKLEKQIICEYCNMQFTRNSSLMKHKKICANKVQRDMDIENKMKILLLENDRYKKESEHFQAENAYHKQMLNEAGGLVKKSVSTLSYVMHNYGSAPTIEMLDVDDLEDLEQNNKKLVEDVISAHKHKTLDKYLGDSIATLYKKDNPKDQSVWSTDTSRLTYLIKELMVNNSSNWIIDKKGTKTKEYLIDPLLKHIRVLVMDYQETMSMGKNICEMEYNAEINKQILKLITDIDDEIVGNNLLKYISSHLFFNDKLLK